jgi:hypothetical protein
MTIARIILNTAVDDSVALELAIDCAISVNTDWDEGAVEYVFEDGSSLFSCDSKVLALN